MRPEGCDLLSSSWLRLPPLLLRPPPLLLLTQAVLLSQVETPQGLQPFLPCHRARLLTLPPACSTPWPKTPKPVAPAVA